MKFLFIAAPCRPFARRSLGMPPAPRDMGSSRVNRKRSRPLRWPNRSPTRQLPFLAQSAKTAPKLRRNPPSPRSMSRAGERFRPKQRFELILGEQFLFQHEVVDAAPGLERLARHLGGVGVSDVRIERGDDADGALDALAQVLAIRGYANHAAIRQRAAARAQVIYALENRMRDDRLERVELQLAGLGGERHCQIVADDLEGDLIDDLRDDWVDLARHDARTSLHWRQVDFT